MPTIRFSDRSNVVVKTAPPAAPPPETTLFMAAAFTNPNHWKSRLKLFQQFQAYMNTLPNVRLYVGEIAYGNDAFQVTSPTNPQHLQLRAQQVMWHKENILNLVIQKRFPKNWLYGGYSDGDFSFSRFDLGTAAIAALQTSDWVQLFSDYSSLSAEERVNSTDSSFSWCRKVGKKVEGDPKYGDVEVGATGGAWAFRRDAFDAAGGLLDFCIVGSGDWHMTFGLYGIGNPHPEIKHCFPGYVKAIEDWQAKAFSNLKRGVSYLESHATHYWHGPMISRQYGTRWQVMKDNDFDPTRDLYRNADGVWQLVPAKQAIADGILAYFAAMNSDSTEPDTEEADAPLMATAAA